MSSSKKLEDENVKWELINYVKSLGYSIRKAAIKIGIDVRSAQIFMQKKSYKSFWDSNEDHLESYYNGFKTETVVTPKVKMLFFDIETAPIQAAVWGLWENNVSLDMIDVDWYILSFCAKWADSDEIIYYDKRDNWFDENDGEILKELWKLLDEADIVVGQNSKKFDEKKANARFIIHGMKPTSPYRSIDTLEIAKRYFGFTSNKLEYMSSKLCKKYKKLTHGKFPGYKLWKECLKGNMEAWNEMEEYNKHDVLALQELYNILKPYTRNHPNINVYSDEENTVCSCGHDTFTHSGYHYTNTGKYDRFKCDNCGTSVRGKVNLLSKSKRESLMSNIV